MNRTTNKSLTARPDGTSSEISDLYGAAYLTAVGQRVLGVELNGDGRNRLIFAAGDGLTAAYLDFLNNAQIWSPKLHLWHLCPEAIDARSRKRMAA